MRSKLFGCIQLQFSEVVLFGFYLLNGIGYFLNQIFLIKILYLK